MRKNLLAAACVTAFLCIGAQAAQAYDFKLAYQYGGDIFTIDPVQGFQDEPVNLTGTITATSLDAQPDFISFDNGDIRVTYNHGSFLIDTQFDVLGGRGYTVGTYGASGLFGDLPFGASVYGSDNTGRSFSGNISGTLSVAAVSSVPLPASAPLLGSALLGLGLLGYGVRRRKTVSA